jgi:hypothetical protein
MSGMSTYEPRQVGVAPRGLRRDRALGLRPRASFGVSAHSGDDPWREEKKAHSISYLVYESCRALPRATMCHPTVVQPSGQGLLQRRIALSLQPKEAGSRIAA